MGLITVTVQEGQTLLDVSIQHLGSAEGVVELARLNGISITKELEVGQVLKMDTAQVINPKMVDYLVKKNIIPVTY